ncbi:protein of unknown function [Legionella micdadei]|uniref:Uncharacterized protein n=1 Tax=Legionella micdadei TaxID=451 RepID=A0A098GJL8_LEGMI|nr:protein of unknown function [Legionella micdadei]
MQLRSVFHSKPLFSPILKIISLIFKKLLFVGVIIHATIEQNYSCFELIISFK